MGRSPVSNVASAVGSKLFGPMRTLADAREPSLLAKEAPELQAAVEQRRERLGEQQARLYWSGCYTDDAFQLVVGARSAHR